MEPEPPRIHRLRCIETAILCIMAAFMVMYPPLFMDWNHLATGDQLNGYARTMAVFIGPTALVYLIVNQARDRETARLESQSTEE